jgi:type I restriction enzyme S subunit
MSFDLPIPNGWRLVKLSDLGEVNRGRSRHRPRDAGHLYGGKYPFVQTGDVKASGGRITVFTQTYSENGLAQSRLWPKGTMCITIAANIAETGILQFPACFPDSVIGFIADESKCNVHFIEYVFRLLRKRIQAQATGSVQDNINLQTLERLMFPIPELPEQNKIAEVLCSFDDKIALNTQTNQTLEAIAQAIFKSWFVDFEPVKAKIAASEAGGTAEEAERAAIGAISGKDEAALTQLQTEQPDVYAELAQTAALFPSSMQDSELGEIPEGWKVGSIGDIAKAKGGYAFKSNQFIEIGSPVVKIKNITGSGTVDISDCQCISDKDAKSAERFQLFDGDLVMAMTGATVGKIGLMNTHGRSAYLNQRVAKFESNAFGPEVSCFLFCVFNRSEVFDAVVGAAQGSAQPNISSSVIESTRLVAPSERLVKQFINSVQPLFYRWLKNNDESLTLALSRDNLLPKLLSGEIDLSQAADVADEVGV